MNFGISYTFNKLDFQNIAQPFSLLAEAESFWISDFKNANNGKIEERTVQLQPNEFTDNDDIYGLFESENQSTTYLVPLNVEKEEKEAKYNITYPSHPDQNLPQMKIEFVLSRYKVLNERTQYTAFDFLSDIGGFWGALILLPNYFMAFYNSKMFAKQLTDESKFTYLAKQKKKKRKAATE